jgi:beta-galactosidase
VFGARSGTKDARGQMVQAPAPGLAAALCGAVVEDWTLVMPHEAPQSCDWGGARVPAPHLAETLAPQGGAEVLARYDAGCYKGAPALVRKRRGDGAAYYYGSGFTVSGARAFLDKLGVRSPLAPFVGLPPQVGACLREAPDGRRALFLLNYGGEPAQVTLHRPAPDLLAPGAPALDGPQAMEPYGVMALSIPKGAALPIP